MPIHSIGTKLGTNYMPRNEEMTAIRQILAQPTTILHELEVRISTLQATCRNLLDERNQLKYRVDAHNALLTPMRRVPDDILAEIFLYCLPRGRNPAMSSTEAPLLLGRVCSRWRKVSAASPRLWAALHVSVPLDYRNPCLGLVDPAEKLHATMEWLSRSGDCPLSISLFVSPASGLEPSVSRVIIQPYLDIFLPMVRRWKSIRFSFPGIFWFQFFSGVRESDVPLLEVLHVKERKPSGATSVSSIRIATLTASSLMRGPRLRSISLPRHQMLYSELPLGWAGLTELDISQSTTSLTDIARVLCFCHQLKYCRLRLPRASSFLNVDLPHISLPKLLALTLIEGTIAHVSRLLEVMNTPHIRHLSFERIFSTYSQEVENRRPLYDSLTMLTQGASQPIEELSLGAIRLWEMDVMTILSLLPGLKRLKLSCAGRYLGSSAFNFSFDDNQLKKFIPGKTHEIVGPNWETSFRPESDSDRVHPLACLCPNLEVLHCTGASFSGPVLLKFLRNRSRISSQTPQVVPLRQVDIKFSTGWLLSGRMRRKIKRLEADTGMVVNLTDPLSFPSGYSAYNGTSQSMSLTSTTSRQYFTF